MALWGARPAAPRAYDETTARTRAEGPPEVRATDRRTLTSMALDLARRELGAYLAASDKGEPVLSPRDLTALLGRILELERAEDAPTAPSAEPEDERYPGLADMSDAELSDMRRLVKKARGQ